MNPFGELTLIALGSNKKSSWGDAAETVQKAMMALKRLTHSAVERSLLYVTPAFPADTGPDYINAAVALRTTLTAPKVLDALHQIETEAGRTRDGRWTQRTLDLDLIAMGDLVCPDIKTQEYWRNLPLAKQQQKAPDGLILPHPRVQDRSFVLVPLCDVAPDWRHPLLGITVRDMLAACNAEDIASVVEMS